MKYTEQQRLEIGRRIYDGEINRFIAAELYNVSPSTGLEIICVCTDMKITFQKKT